MQLEVIAERDDLVIHRMVLDPGEATFWHTDACERCSVIVRGSRLAIEFQGDGQVVEFGVTAGTTGWDEPEQRVHRAINRGRDVYEEVVTFYRSSREVEPQPRSDLHA